VSLLERLLDCTRHDLSRFLPWQVAGRPAGHVAAERVPLLLSVRDADGRAVFERAAPGAPGAGSNSAPGPPAARHGALQLAAHLDDFARRSAALSRVVAELHRAALIPAPTGEMYPVAERPGAAPWLQLERAAMPAFGARACGVHLHGYVRRRDGLHMWIARRARNRTTFPGMLDNMVAGGQPLGLSAEQTLVKECAEEADVPEALARAAVPTGALRYLMEAPRGLRDDTLFLFDLELPPDFRPRNTDGEVESFELWPVERVMQRVAETRDFKFNCNLTIIDFLLRHGVVGSDHPERDALVAGLRAHTP